VGSQISVLWDRRDSDLQIIAALYVIAMSCSSTKQRRDRATPMTLPLRDHRRRRARVVPLTTHRISKEAQHNRS
jgi:hypothetical protein